MLILVIVGLVLLFEGGGGCNCGRGAGWDPPVLMSARGPHV
jgi:hypothetical protein